MEAFKFFPVHDNFTVRVTHMTRGPQYPATVQDMVEKIWDNEQRKHKGTLYNGSLLSLVSLEQDELIGELVEYKYYLAQVRKPELRPYLQVKPVSISGITQCAKTLLVGTRASTVTDSPGLYELVPSGGMDPELHKNNVIDVKKQFLVELEEEAGIKEQLVKEFHPIGLLYDSQSECLEYCASLELDSKVKKFFHPPKEEYAEMHWMTKKRLLRLATSEPQKFVPLTLYLLNHFAQKL